MWGLVRACVTSCVFVGVMAAWLPGQRAAYGDATQQIWLHYDYMVMPNGHSLAPDPQSIQPVVDAFAAHGIALHIDSQHALLPYHALLDFGGSVDARVCAQFGYGPSDVVEFNTLKTQYFHPTANHDWHYVIFGDLSACTVQTGIADLPGNDFVVSLGALLREGLHVVPYFEGGTFMHELGHNLGLLHPTPNRSSNDLSVMNYRFQFGIPYAAMPGSTSIAGRKLDYSEEALPTLDESHLEETAGLGATLPSDRTDITTWANPNASSVDTFTVFGPASGPIDWNHDGVLESDVAVDLDYPFNELECGSGFVDPTCDALQWFERQRGVDEWAEVHQFLAGAINPGPKTFERETRAAEPIVSAVTPASGPEAGGNTVTIQGAHFEKVTQVSFGNERAASFSVLNDGTLSVVVPPGQGTVDVTATAGDNPSPSVSSDQYTYLPPPRVSSVSPIGGVPGTAVTIAGTNLTGATAVDFGSSAAPSFTVVNDQTMTAVAPPGTDSVIVTVTGPGGTSAASPLDSFTYAPTVTSLSPTSGMPGTLVTIHGTSFAGATGVCFGTSCVAAWTVVDDSTITIAVPFSPLEGSTVDVTVTNAGGSSPAGPGDRFTLM